jgi:2-polyprenyl-3-methyl-5-hydroxy-6-metoxy-1,4-benzoquinol methylase
MNIDQSQEAFLCDLKNRIKQNNEDRNKLMREALAVNGIDPVTIEKLIKKGIPQSQLFMVEIIPFLHKLYLNLPELQTKTALDIGPLNFAGTALLSSIHHRSSPNRLRLQVSALDIESRLAVMKEIVAPEIEFICGDLYKLKNRLFDVVIASHVVEHVPQPAKFMRAMQEISKDFVIIAAPWMEEFPLTRSHINVVDKNLVAEVGGEDLQIFTNYCWGKHRRVCLFKLPGLAG